MAGPRLETAAAFVPALSPDLPPVAGMNPQADGRVELSRAGDFISQIAERHTAGKQSCVLTSQLNAHIALGELDTFTALDAQNELADSWEYAAYWSEPLAGPHHSWRAWQARPSRLATLLTEDFGVEAAAPERSLAGGDLRPVVESHLRRGRVAVIVGLGATAAHARLAFEPAGHQDTLFIHDPYSADATGLYGYDALRQLQNAPRAILY